MHDQRSVVRRTPASSIISLFILSEEVDSLNELICAIVAIGLVILIRSLVNVARRARDSQKGSAARAMYANKPFSLSVRTWLREPSSPQGQAWKSGHLSITESWASWRPTASFSKPIAITGAKLLRSRLYGLGPTDLRIPPAMLILVFKAGNREIELALPRPNAEIVIYGLSQSNRGQTIQPGHPGTQAPASSDT